MAKKAGSDIIDLSYGLEGQPDVVLRAPWVEREIGSVPRVDLAGAPVRVAHPAAMVLALLLLRAAKVAKVSRAIATAFEPASERGKRGMDELHEQTVNLLSFQQLPKAVFDSQVAFNLIDRYGAKSLPSLDTIEKRIQSDFQRIVHDKVAVPSLMLLQAPIFHGHAFSLYIELERPVKDRGIDPRALRRACRDIARRRGLAQQRQRRGTGEHSGHGQAGFGARQWILDLGGLRQLACRRAGCCRMRRVPHTRTSARDRAVMRLRLRDLVGCCSQRCIFLLASLGCGYHTSGHAVRLPDDIHTLYVPMFDNTTQTFRVEQTMTAAVVQELRSRTNFRIVTSNDGTADATLKGMVNYTSNTAADLRLGYRTHFLVCDNRQ